MRIKNHICNIMLCHFEKGWKAALSFSDFNELFVNVKIEGRQF